MPRRTVFPEDHWSLRVDIPYSMGLACGDLIFLCGQADLEGDGEVCNAGDLLVQTQSALAHIAKLFGELDADLENLAKLVVFYVPDATISEADYITALSGILDTHNRPVITLVPVPRMFYPGLVVEIDVYGMSGESLARVDVPDRNGFSAVVRAGEMIFSGGIDAIDESGAVIVADDVVLQSQAVLAELSSRIAGLKDIGTGRYICLLNMACAVGSWCLSVDRFRWILMPTSSIQAKSKSRPGPAGITSARCLPDSGLNTLISSNSTRTMRARAVRMSWMTPMICIATSRFGAVISTNPGRRRPEFRFAAWPMKAC
jgi:enamine deaminase RidA (YjgF/YER057c/UK114 family)